MRLVAEKDADYQRFALQEEKVAKKMVKKCAEKFAVSNKSTIFATR